MTNLKQSCLSLQTGFFRVTQSFVAQLASSSIQLSRLISQGTRLLAAQDRVSESWTRRPSAGETAIQIFWFSFYRTACQRWTTTPSRQRLIWRDITGWMTRTSAMKLLISCEMDCHLIQLQGSSWYNRIYCNSRSVVDDFVRLRTTY